MIWTIRTGSGSYVLREQIEPADEPGLLDLFRSCNDWFEAVTGGPSGNGDVQGLFYSLPEGARFEDKRLFTLRDGERIVGFIDVVLGYPHRRACSIGTFLLAPSHRRAGIGTAVSRVLLEEARHAGIDEVIASADDRWPQGIAFLRSLGFTTDEPDGQSAPRRAVLTLSAVD
ncbi:GNAT family N-acetyltransferase [Haloactinopolyspora sp.]|uniref:GNAT family N-acetyltransferase n=1 Tax=Haloactinopolyspora sp. TaxID=1966353 RepID=UPI0026153D80|nr:GNAT family N-acetyltransferase [Haloactinopolyspora sp.]